MSREISRQKGCGDCGIVKPLDDFHRNSHHSDGRQGWCKQCHNTRARNWRKANPGYYQKRLERDPDYFRRQKIKSRYGLSWEEYQELLRQSGGRCAICAGPLADPRVDHDHLTGQVRGVLCPTCNAALGFVERPGWLQAALAYLAAHAQDTAIAAVEEKLAERKEPR